MQIEQTELDGVFTIIPKRIADSRGFFCESWNRNTLAAHDITTDFVQDNHSYSKHKNTLRGLHYQSPPHAQVKLVSVVRGAIFDVAVDVRVGSPQFGRWIGVELSAQNGRQLYIPQGFLHGFVTLQDDTDVCYKCSDFYAPKCDGGVAFDDPAFAIDWGVTRAQAILSDKDAAAPKFNEIAPPFTLEGLS